MKNIESAIENVKNLENERTNKSTKSSGATCVPTKRTSDKSLKTISQDEIARQISAKLGVTLELVTDIVTEEQKLTMLYVSNGYRVVKKNFLTLSIRTMPERKFTSPLDKKAYHVPEKKFVRCKVGEGFIDFCNKHIKERKEPMCKFVKRIDN